MAKSVWKIKDYGSGWSADEISNDMNKLAQDRWEVHQMMWTTNDFRVSRYPDPLPGLNDGDHVYVSAMMRVVFKK